MTAGRFVSTVRVMDFELAGPMRRGSVVDVARAGEQRARLRRTHGRGTWQTLGALATVRLRDGSVHKAVVHWCAAEGTGRREIKLKFPLVD